MSDTLTVCEARGMQLLIRFPPDGRNPLSEECMERLHASPCATLDDGHPYLVPPAEAIWHASVVCSINSTMLLEALLMGRGAFSTKYVEFDQLWAHADLPVARNIGEIRARMEEALSKPGLTDRGKAWVEEALAGGSLDGESRARIHPGLAPSWARNGRCQEFCVRPKAGDMKGIAHGQELERPYLERCRRPKVEQRWQSGVASGVD